MIVAIFLKALGQLNLVSVLNKLLYRFFSHVFYTEHDYFATTVHLYHLPHFCVDGDCNGLAGRFALATDLLNTQRRSEYWACTV